MNYKEFITQNGVYNPERDIFSLQSNGGDEYYTMRQHVEDIASALIPMKNTVIWCPFDRDDSMFPVVLKELGYSNVVNTSSDFFQTEPPESCGAIISNPPFSIKKDILIKIKDLNIPFALMMPFLFLNDGVPLDYGSQLILWRKRVHFLQPDGERNKPRTTCFVLSNGLLKRDLTIIYDKENKQ